MNEQAIIDCVEELKAVKEEIIAAAEDKALSAKIAYNRALCRAQAEFKKIEKKGHNARFGAGGKYAMHDEIVSAVYSALATEGIAHKNKGGFVDGIYSLKTVLGHEMGHEEESIFPIIPIGSISPDKAQLIAGGMTYGKKYNLTALTGVAFNGLEIDDDGEGMVNGNGSMISQTHLKELKKLLISLPPHVEQELLEAVGIDSLKELRMSQFNSTQRKLKARVESQNEAN